MRLEYNHPELGVISQDLDEFLQIRSGLPFTLFPNEGTRQFYKRHRADEFISWITEPVYNLPREFGELPEGTRLVGRIKKIWEQKERLY